MLVHCHVLDLSVKNYKDYNNNYDVGIVINVVESYATFVSSKPTPKIFYVGRLIDCYHTLVARDENLVQKFSVTCRNIAKRCSVIR